MEEEETARTGRPTTLYTVHRLDRAQGPRNRLSLFPPFLQLPQPSLRSFHSINISFQVNYDKYSFEFSKKQPIHMFLILRNFDRLFVSYVI